MRNAHLLFFILITRGIMNAQPATSSLAGEYYLRGVMETASGFKLNTDSTFQFFFSYGSLDRYGSGKWTSKNDHVTLNSEIKHPRDFALVRSMKKPGDHITIKILDANPHLLHYMYGLISSGYSGQQDTADADGQMTFRPQKLDTIVLLFEFCPEKQSVFTIPGGSDNYFEFRIEPWIMEVYFDNLDLQITENGLEGSHPLLVETRKYLYEKAVH
jgi:hypothetical protein